MSTKHLPKFNFFIDTCAGAKDLMHAFETSLDLLIAADREEIPGWERKAHITNTMTYQIFRELAKTTEPGMALLSPLAQQLLHRPEFNLVVETPVCRRFLSRLHEKCIKPHIIDAVLWNNPDLCEKLLEEAERLRRIAKDGKVGDLRPIQLFDASGVIRDSYVVQALRSTQDGSKDANRMLWDHLHDTKELKFARKDAGEFSILAALANKDPRILQRPFSAVIVTKDSGARNMFEATYAGKLPEYCKKLLTSRKKVRRRRASRIARYCHMISLPSG